MKLKRIGVDLAKQVFQVHGVDSHEQVKCRKQLTRHQMQDFSANWSRVWWRWRPVAARITGLVN